MNVEGETAEEVCEKVSKVMGIDARYLEAIEKHSMRKGTANDSQI